MEGFENDLKKVISLEERAKMKASLQELEYNKYSKKRNRSYLFVAASIAVLISFIGYSLIVNQKTSTDDLYAEYFESYRNVIQPITRGVESKNNSTKAFEAYEKGNYKKASTLLIKAYSEDKNNAYLLYQGISFLQLNNSDKAIEVLNKQLEITDKFNIKTHWYLALAYLKNNEVIKAKKSLEKVLDSSGDYKKQEAKSILRNLN
ncbi:tetratricopeptide repeat protein [Tenacibaculum halocynthiae]|uniref:tetratricopeptide repeat protein n=1 Tax=Tenacibaculum halocynthiae TaxID=1254437 RepID=UPI0038962CB4